MSRTLHSIAFTLVLSLSGVVLLMTPFGAWAEREFGLAWLFQLRGPVQPPEEVAVIGINSRSGPDMGLSRLPRNWPRSLHGLLVGRLAEADARTVAFDMDFSQPKEPIEDATFADALRVHGDVVLFERLEGRTEYFVSGNGNTRAVWIEQSMPPNDVLAPAARAIAPFPLPKIDKSSFQFWAFKPSADDQPTIPAVAVQLAVMEHHQSWRQILERAGVQSSLVPPSTRLKSSEQLIGYMKGMRKLFLGKPFLKEEVLRHAETSQLDSAARDAVRTLALLYGGLDERYTNYYGEPGTIPTTAYQVIVGIDEIGLASTPANVPANEPSRQLAGKTVFVGYSDLNSPDQPDRFHTVFTSERGIDLSGLEIMATAFANLRTNSTIMPVEPVLAAAIAFVFGLVICQLIYWPTPYVAVPAALIVAAGYFYGAVELFASENLWLPVAVPIAVQLPFAIIAGLLGQYILERRERHRVGAAIANYLPEHLARDLTAGRMNADSLNQVVHGVCLANDMSGFSRISEHKSPGELATFMNSYFEAVAAALKRCEVDVTEFHADTIMCAWLGEPSEADFRKNALRAALEVVHAIEAFSASDPEVELSARVGLQDGPFYLGHTGGGGRMSYSILGNPANSASRLEGLNKKLGTKIIAAESVIDDLDEFATRPMGTFQVVGKAENISVVEVIGLRQDMTPDATEFVCDFTRALGEFQNEQWELARKSFEALAERRPDDKATQVYIDVCRSYIDTGPPAEAPTRLSMTEK